MPAEIINQISFNLGDFSDVVTLLSSAFVDEPSVNTKDGGFIREGYNAELDELRNISANGRAFIAEIENIVYSAMAAVSKMGRLAR